MKLLVRVDASMQIGTGHVMRCLALAQVWQEAQGQTIFLMAAVTPALEASLQSEGMQVMSLTTKLGSEEDARETAALAHHFQSKWIVVDGYHFRGEYQRLLKQENLRLLFIDDCGHAEHYYADLVLNQNISADERWYQNREPYTQLLLGTRYALLRREFLQWQGWQRIVPRVAKKILVTLGGADPDNVTLKVIRALQLVEVDGLEALVVVGGSNPHYESLEKAVRGSQFPIRLERNVTNMSELMACADVAISASGSTCWELAFMRLPSIVLILTENQRAIAEKLSSLDIAINIGKHNDVTSQHIASTLSLLLFSSEERTKMSQAARQMVKGNGAETIVQHLQGNAICLRVVQKDDCEILWHWANDPVVRAASFSSEPIAWTEHIKWFSTQLSAPNCKIYIALAANRHLLGQVRFKIENEEATISLTLSQNNRGKGYGFQILSLGCELIAKEFPITQINAYIKPNNLASIKLFIKLGFLEQERVFIKGFCAHHFIKYI